MDTLHEVGMTYHKMEKYQQALKALFKEYSIRKKLVNEDELSIACTLREIAHSNDRQVHPHPRSGDKQQLRRLQCLQKVRDTECCRSCGFLPLQV